MNQPRVIIRSRDVGGDPSDTTFGPHKRTEFAGAPLTLGSPKEQPQLWPVAPNQNQMMRAGAEALRRQIIHPSTDENYDAVAAQTKIAFRIADQESCANAYLNGQEHHDDAAYEAIWAGEDKGQSEAIVLARLAELGYQLANLGFEEGNVHPREIIGELAGDSAADLDMARRMGEAHVSTLELAVKTHGRTLELTQIRVCQNRVDTPF